ncbi:MAG: pyridoxine 5'-phosphate synthase [Candidatus Kapabacteria bacterium]|nr:pyridoxine 5'-phosphate synthase [Candidatus Kapabacteria bacterium]
MITLNVNIDHVATIRNARGGIEPEPVHAALQAELAGAQGIVCHLREDRRHIKDRDVILLKQLVQTKLDLEMANTDEIVNIALAIRPNLVTIVPEKRMELTTEGGLNIEAKVYDYKLLCNKMHDKGIEVSFFIEPAFNQIQASLEAGADMVELHTGLYANSLNFIEKNFELERIRQAVIAANKLGLKVAAGHGLNYINTKDIICIKGINEVSIGHSIIARSIYVGIDQAVREMIELIKCTNHNNNNN